MSERNIFQFVPMEEHHGRTVCEWTYPAPYDIYHFPSWEAMAEDQFEFADPRIRQEQYFAALFEDGTLAGYVQLFPIVGVTRLGLGLQPDLCGQGLGARFVKEIVRFAERQKPGNAIDLEVFAWNERAIGAYRKAGFEVTDTYEKMSPNGPQLLVCMEYIIIPTK